MRKPSEVITQKKQIIYNNLLYHVTKQNPKPTKEQLAVLDLAAFCEAITLYLDDMFAVANTKKSSSPEKP